MRDPESEFYIRAKVIVQNTYTFTFWSQVLVTSPPCRSPEALPGDLCCPPVGAAHRRLEVQGTPLSRWRIRTHCSHPDSP